MRVELAPKARQDIREIRQYTRKRWGTEQADAYHDKILNALETIRGNPALGVAREDLGAGLRSHTFQQHRILYRVSDELVRVLRIVHVRQDEETQLARQR